ncbi:AAA family ATPase [Faecalibacterium langellae]|jgi:predicted AAA+ superfamily ATPase|uniref:AAA family ATPase n=1 Tax=Faecalibacterium langellae TaxID=3435293 RepID=A0A2A6ZDM7_9FIRM|nr:ATP-binding protein [Faecalibacterium prausnitzii]PDX59414.1 AAA family ATPase [Faecalibacterium prausnitzii]
MKLREWNARLHGLVVFRSLLDDPVVAKLVDLTDRMEAGAPGYGPVCDAVAQFEAALFEHTTNWGSYLSAAVLEAETVCVRQAASGTLAPALQTALDSELAFLQALCGLTLDELLAAAGSATGQAQELAFLPRWETSSIDLPAAYAQRMSEVGKKGYGMFAKHHVFTVENGQLVPVKYPDPQRLSELPGYEKEREKVIANTKALLAGMPANNVLLYGDAGTGKSSAVKAIANEFAPEGLRLVEVKKNQLYQIPDLMDKLAANPLKFILFIDDLSFTANDDNFAALKAILEGSVGGRAKNIAVYATSNRRHLIKETLTDRTGDDIHEADTRQELMSLSARFGLTVTFQRPEKARFETILAELAKQHGIDMPMDQLLVKAEAFAIRAGGRSPRVAKQFIEQCESGVQK